MNKKKLAVLGAVIFASFMLGFFLNCFVSNDYVLRIDFSLLFNGRTLAFSGFFMTVFLLLFLSRQYKRIETSGVKKVLQGLEEDKRIEANLEQARFQTEREIDKNFVKVEYGELKRKNISGIPIKTELKKGKLYIHLAPNAHTLIIGTTGSGKTTTFISPTIQILSQSKDKPSMFISDPKGELFALHSTALIEKGYDVKVLDLRNPFYSIKWNPLEKPFMLYKRMLNLESEVQKNEETGSYLFDNSSYADRESLELAIQVKKQIIYDTVYEDLHDIIGALCPVNNRNEPIWESGAQNLILSIALAMLEDSENPELGMTADKYNFYNIAKIATNTENDCAELTKYFQGRGNLSRARSLSKQVLDASEKTRGSYLSTVFDKLNMFADLSICSLTSANEITFADMAEKPIAFFLQIPDEKETRYPLASLVVLQAYKELVAKANEYNNLSLPRSVYFLMDEFGNLPKIPKLEQMVTVGRSRNIWLCLVVQSYAQLANVYDEKCADIIRSNCNNQIFIGTTDPKTIDEFSKRCGNYTVITRNAGYNSSKPEDINSNASVRERPLIYPSELAQLNRPGNMGNAVITIFGYMPILSKYVPSYDCSAYTLKPAKCRQATGQYFDESKIFYNVSRRNEIILGIKPTKNNAKTKLTESLNDIIENIKREMEQSADAKILSDEDKISLFNLIDSHSFTEAKSIIEAASMKAASINQDHLIDTFQKIIRKLNWPQHNYDF